MGVLTVRAPDYLAKLQHAVRLAMVTHAFQYTPVDHRAFKKSDQLTRLCRALAPIPTDPADLVKRRGHWLLVDTINGQILALRTERL